MPLASASRSRTVRTQSREQPGRRRRPFVVDLAAALCIASAVAWAFGLIVFMRAIPEAVEDSESRTDAIVVLTGGAERLATGLKLLEADKASAVLVSGVNPQVGVREVLRAAGNGKADALVARVAAGHGARDTAGNAAEAAQWMRHHGFRSLRLVTASYHMPRSRFEFARALPDIRVIPHPVFPLPATKHLWWRDPKVLGLIVGEYNKLLMSGLMYGAASIYAIGKSLA